MFKTPNLISKFIAIKKHNGSYAQKSSTQSKVRPDLRVISDPPEIAISDKRRIH